MRSNNLIVILQLYKYINIEKIVLQSSVLKKSYREREGKKYVAMSTHGEQPIIYFKLNSRSYYIARYSNEIAIKI